MKEGDELRKSLLDKLFSLNSILSAVFIVLFQLDKTLSGIRFLNILPIITVLLILIFQVVELRILGEAYYKIDLWKKGDFDFLRKAKKISSNIILLAVILTIIEIFYLFKILLNLNIA